MLTNDDNKKPKEHISIVWHYTIILKKSHH